MKKLLFVNSHPIQYFAPLYKYLNEQGVTTEAWYGANTVSNASCDEEFGVEVKWDIPLLEGYPHRFFSNQSPKPSHEKGFFGLMNLGMIRQLFQMPPSVIVVHGWHYFTHFFVLMLAGLKDHTVCVRCDVPQKQEALKSGWKQKLKQFGLKHILFPRIDYFLYIGSQNRLFYKTYGIADDHLLSCPYAVDNDRFRQEYMRLQNQVPDIKTKLGIPADGKVILFTAKYIEKKRPLDLLAAFAQLNRPDCWLVMVGEGTLREEMEAFIKQHNVKNVLLTGFVNQSAITAYYAISNMFVMCSAAGENWGLSVNEAMNFNLPLVLSDLTGCADDLVVEGDNGYVIKTGDVQALKEKLEAVLYGNGLAWKTPSEKIVDRYSYRMFLKGIQNLTGQPKTSLSTQPALLQPL